MTKPITVIKEKRRGCGYRKKGGVYLVSEPGGGVLPLFVLTEPPVPYTGKHFRGTVLVDLDRVLECLPEDEWLVGASRERHERQLRASAEIEQWGMSLKERERIGIGLAGLKGLRLVNVKVIGSQLRWLAGCKLGQAQNEIPKAFRKLQEGDLQGLLACLWRLWRNCPPKQRVHAKHYIQCAMYYLNAIGDSVWIEEEYDQGKS